MSNQEQYFNKIAGQIIGSVKGQMFGKPCFKINKKAFTCFFKESMVFKLEGEYFENAINLKDSKLFDPSGKGRPMKQWVQVSFDNKKTWKIFAKNSARYVYKITKQNK